MDKLVINGGKKLKGTIRVSGAKNSVVALIPAAILASDEVTICNVPEITDKKSLIDILKFLEVDVEEASEAVVIRPEKLKNKDIPKEISSKLRASYYFMGALLAKFGYVKMHFPGGCSIGERPIDLHLKGFEALGAKVNVDGPVIEVKAEKLKGDTIFLDIASVGATLNIMIAATLAEGETVIENAAKEPEIVNVATFLNNIGARISGAGTSVIKIEGVKKLSGGFQEVIPDRIEAGTYIIIGALIGDKLKVDNLIPEHIEALTLKLEDMGVPIKIGPDYVEVSRAKNLKPTKLKTLVYPGFPTDLQQPFTVLMTQANGESKVTETIWENRFMQVPYLNKMGANITKLTNTSSKITGPTELFGKEVEATDLRAGAAMVAAGLTASGITTIGNIGHILRGYENLVEKLTYVGADIKIINEES